MHTLSQRLETIASLLKPGNQLGDIGTDHGYLLVNIITKGLFHSALGVELNCGPLKSARNAVHEASLEEQIQLRLGNGLEPLDPGEVDALVIAGMGGHTICGILENGIDKLMGVTQMVLQPQSAPYRVRHTLAKIGFVIQDERLVKEDRIYVIIYAVPGHMGPLNWEDEQIGPVLRHDRPDHYGLYVMQMIKERERIVRSMKQACKPDLNRIETLQNEICRLKEQL